MAALQGGELFTWGWNHFGQLGWGATDDNTDDTPTRVGSATDWSAVSAGANFMCGLEGSALSCWGSGSYGELGLGDTAPYSDVASPTAVGSASWSKITAGERSACGIQTDGTLWCWGANEIGEVGNNGDGSDVTSPAQESTQATNWASVSAGATNTCAITTDHKLYCWGDGTYGQLGNSAFLSYSYSPIQVTGTTWQSVSVGHMHACGVQTDNSLWCWGDNSEGQLGDGKAWSSEVQALGL
jgi:hypothetical protein